MHAPADASVLHPTWRHPAGSPYYFDSSYAQGLIERFNQTAEPAVVTELLLHCEPLLRSYFEYRGTVRHVPLEDLLNTARIKLWKSLPLFDVNRGTAFSFVSKVATSVGMSLVGETWKLKDRQVPLDVALCDRLSTREFDYYALTDVEFRIRAEIRTTCTDPYELGAQRWYVASFIDSGFNLRRWEAANSAMQVFGLSHDVARRLYDETLVAIRRVLIGDRAIRPISPQSLRHSRSAALIRYAPYLSENEFSRLAVLMSRDSAEFNQGS